ncbi:MAG: GrpB family protein [bacterium]
MNILPYHLPEVLYLPYDDQLPRVAEMLEMAIKAALPDLEVDHIGSTSIPGMPGKNSLNLVVLCSRDRFPAVLKLLEDLGFQNHPFKHEPADRPLKVGSIEHGGKLYGIHVHVLEKDSDNHRNSLFFRDYLRSHPDEAKQYAELKRSLVGRKMSSEEYNAAKQPFILEILVKRDLN